MGIRVKSRYTMDKSLRKMRKVDIQSFLNTMGQEGVSALAAATPKDTGLTASLWSYEISKSGESPAIYWTNDHIENGTVVIAVILQYGHGTGTGGYVRGRDYINPAIQPIFDTIADRVWEEVTSS